MRAGVFPSLSLAAVLAVAGFSGTVACGEDHAEIVAANPDSGTVTPQGLCVDGKPVDWPPGPYEMDLLKTLPPNLVFEGPDGPVAMHDFFEPCAAQSRLLVVRTSASWCGTCNWHIGHTKRLMDDPRFSGRLLFVDLLIADEDNMPPTMDAAKRFGDRMDAKGKVALDPAYTFRPVLRARSPLPEYVFIDTRTMQIRSVGENPDSDNIVNKILLEVADLDKAPRPNLTPPKLFDNLFTQDQWDLIRDMRFVAAPPPDPTNEYGDLPAAADLGKQLFSDVLLSPTSNLSCATCHAPGLAFGDGQAQSVGVSKVDRNSPSVALAAHSRWQFWDGRADTLWMQALGPPENAKEIGSNRLFIAHQIATRYAASYAAVFGAKYPLPDLSALPANGKPGDAAYDAMSAQDKDNVTRIYVNMGKALAAFQRSLRVKTNTLDDYIDGNVNALAPPQKGALLGFLRSGCAQCHWGPRLTDDAFHVLRFPTGRVDGTPDRGRLDVLPTLASSEFVASSKWSDSPASAKLLTLPSAPSMLGAFKTPTLRGIAETGPYGHGGMYTTLADVSHHYGTRGDEIKDDRAVGTTEEWVQPFDVNGQKELPAFLEVLTATVLP